MTYCGDCKKECEVNSYWDSEGDTEPGLRLNYRVNESYCCGAPVFTDAECTKPYEED